MTFADYVLNFLKHLEIKESLDSEIGVLNPYQNESAFELCRQFFRKYYDDTFERTLILGINPGRHGAGLTGIPFTDPIKLEEVCEISNEFPKKPELSADFIYAVINAYGGTEKFYRNFYFSSVSPLGFVKDGKNLNYYDSKVLQGQLRKFIIRSLRATMAFGVNTSVCFCLGEGENHKYLARLNNELELFDRIIPLAHPRYIMQYKRKRVNEYILSYLSQLNAH
jgi:hypothetical protein